MGLLGLLAEHFGAISHMFAPARPPKQHETLDTDTVSRLRRDGAAVLSTWPHRLHVAPTFSLDKEVDHVIVLHVVIGGGQRHVEPPPVEHQAER